MDMGAFKEIAHSGGTLKLEVKFSDGNSCSYNFHYTHSSPTPMSMLAVYAIPQGVAVADYNFSRQKPPPIQGCYPVFIASDNTGLFGQQCPTCKMYWRSSNCSKFCPYCSLYSEETYAFLTDAHKRYVALYCKFINDAIISGESGEHIIDFNIVADNVNEQYEKPKFYYTEERQQNLFKCAYCGNINDVIGTYAYCCLCGSRNDIQELAKKINIIRDEINSGNRYEACVKDIVSLFDSFASQYAKQLIGRVPMSTRRKSRLGKIRFHNLMSTHEIFNDYFDINILDKIEDAEVNYGKLMFLRRHVYEHNGGEADEKYIKESGDDVRPKQALHETKESAHRIANFVMRIAQNLHDGFHNIFPPLEGPIQLHKPIKERAQTRNPHILRKELVGPKK